MKTGCPNHRREQSVKELLQKGIMPGTIPGQISFLFVSSSSYMYRQ